MKRFALQKSRVGGKLVCEGGLNFPVEGLGLRVYFPQLFGGYVEREEGFGEMLFYGTESGGGGWGAVEDFELEIGVEMVIIW